MSSSADAPRRSMATSAVAVSLASALNILLGFAFQVALAALFGAGSEMDAFLAAFTIPSILTVVLFSALSITFVPVFIEYQVRGQGDESWTVVSGFLYLCGGTLVALTAALALLARPIVAWTTPGFVGEGAILALTVDLFRLLLPSVIFTGVASLLRSYYHARRRFMLAALAPVLNSLLMVVGSVALAPLLGVRAVALATTLGSLAQCALLVPGVLGQRWPSPLRAVRHPGVLRIVLLMLPWVASAVFYKSNVLIDRFLGSQIDVGAISALGYANRLMTASVQVLTQGISVVMFPLMAEHVAAGDNDRLRVVAAQGIRLTVLLALPASALLLILSEPLVRLLLERGQFDASATSATSIALRAYMGAFFATSIGSILTYVFYARQETGTVAIIGIVSFGINVLAALTLTPLLGVAGPALAFSLSALFNLIVLTWLLQRRLHGLELARLGAIGLKSAVAAVPACLIWLWGAKLSATLPSNTISLALSLTVPGLLGAAVFAAVGFALRVDELQLVVDLLRRRLRGLRTVALAERR